jgi:cobalt/nickel transport system ATP-binding protein
MSQPTAILRVVHVSVRYPGSSRAVLDACSIEISRGERVALLGLNGSGKTTLLLAIAGILPFEGSVTVDGIRLEPASVGSVRSRIGFLFSNPEDQLLFPRVRDDVEYGLVREGMNAGEASQGATRMMEALGVSGLADASPYELSHGQKLRVALAGSLVHKPPMVLLDEPSSALDPPGRRALASTLREQPGAMLMATHDLEFALWCCTRFVLLEAGKVVRDTADPEGITL